MGDITYWNKRHAALTLICAGADNTACATYPLLSRAVHQNDIKAIAVLFNNNANPYQKTLFGPIFFSINNANITQMFIAQFEKHNKIAQQFAENEEPMQE